MESGYAALHVTDTYFEQTVSLFLKTLWVNITRLKMTPAAY